MRKNTPKEAFEEQIHREGAIRHKSTGKELLRHKSTGKGAAEAQIHRERSHKAQKSRGRNRSEMISAHQVSPVPLCRGFFLSIFPVFFTSLFYKSFSYTFSRFYKYLFFVIICSLRTSASCATRASTLSGQLLPVLFAQIISGHLLPVPLAQILCCHFPVIRKDHRGQRHVRGKL